MNTFCLFLVVGLEVGHGWRRMWVHVQFVSLEESGVV